MQYAACSAQTRVSASSGCRLAAVSEILPKELNGKQLFLSGLQKASAKLGHQQAYEVADKSFMTVIDNFNVETNTRMTAATAAARLESFLFYIFSNVIFGATIVEGNVDIRLYVGYCCIKITFPKCTFCETELKEIIT